MRWPCPTSKPSLHLCSLLASLGPQPSLSFALLALTLQPVNSAWVFLIFKPNNNNNNTSKVSFDPASLCWVITSLSLLPFLSKHLKRVVYTQQSQFPHYLLTPQATAIWHSSPELLWPNYQIQWALVHCLSAALMLFTTPSFKCLCFFPSSSKVPKLKSLYLAQAFPLRFNLLYLTACQISPLRWPPVTLLWPKEHGSSYSPPQPQSELRPLLPISLGGSTIYCVMLILSSTSQIWDSVLPCLFPLVSPSLYQTKLFKDKGSALAICAPARHASPGPK